MTRCFAVGTLLVALVVVTVSCAKNPVTGARQMMLISEEQEFAIGQGADSQIRREYGSYLESPSLRTYVDRVGNALAARGERPELVFHFEILDSPEINAFALPGGFVYVTRGILERLSSEDELAVVLGHEIGHVTARHGAARISKLYALQYGSLLGAVISPRTMVHYGDLIDLAIQAGLSRYSREQESQADRLGLEYAAGLDYRAGEAVTVMKILQWLEEKETGALERWFLSHPPAAERIADIEARLSALMQNAPELRSREVRREAYLREIDGLIVGYHNGAEMALRNRYYNKDAGVSLGIPAGWQVHLEPEGALVTMSRADQEFLRLESEPMHLAIDASGIEVEFEKGLRRRGWTRTSGEPALTAQAVPLRLAFYTGATAKGEPIFVACAFMAHQKRRWTLTMVSGEKEADELMPRFRQTATELRFLTEPELAVLQPPRLRLVRAPRGADWPGLAAEHLGDSGEAERLAFYNGLDPAVSPAEGASLKIPPNLSVRP